MRRSLALASLLLVALTAVHAQSVLARRDMYVYEWDMTYWSGLTVPTQQCIAAGAWFALYVLNGLYERGVSPERIRAFSKYWSARSGDQLRDSIERYRRLIGPKGLLLDALLYEAMEAGGT
jgi:hypothetical protein